MPLSIFLLKIVVVVFSLVCFLSLIKYRQKSINIWSNITRQNGVFFIEKFELRPSAPNPNCWPIVAHLLDSIVVTRQRPFYPAVQGSGPNIHCLKLLCNSVKLLRFICSLAVLALYYTFLIHPIFALGLICKKQWSSASLPKLVFTFNTNLPIILEAFRQVSECLSWFKEEF